MVSDRMKTINPGRAPFYKWVYLAPRPLRILGILSLLGLGLEGSPAAIAQSTLPPPASDREPFSQPLPTPQPLPSQPPILAPSPSPQPQPSQSPILIPVRRIEFVGGTLFKPQELANLARPVEGRSVPLADLQAIAEKITQQYLDRGYLTSRAVLEPQTISDGVVKIRLIEGSLEKIELSGLRRLQPGYILSRLRLGAGTPLNKDALEDQLRLLKTDPLLSNLEASLRPGSHVGQSVLSVVATEAPAFQGFVGADNYSPPSVGSDRIGTVLSYNNLTGLGDTLSASYYRSTQGGSNAFDFNYRLPVNPREGAIQLHIAPSNSKIIDPDFSALGIRSHTDLYEISYRQPLIRTSREEFALSLGLSIQDGQTFLFDNVPFPFGKGVASDGTTRTRVLRFGQDYVKKDLQGAWAFRSQFNLGLGILGATSNAAPIPDGRFFSWVGQVQRVQRLGLDHLLVAQLDLQLTPDSLLPSQQFVIGGGQSLRGYRQNARSGDNGFRLSLEDRIALQRDAAGLPMLQLVPFWDTGAVWNQASNPNHLVGETFLSSIGLGFRWEPIPRFSMQVDYARPLIAWSGRGNNAQDEGLYFNVGYRF